MFGGVTLAALALCLPVGASVRTLPAPVTLHGVGGVVPEMTLEQVRQVWRIALPVHLVAGPNLADFHGTIRVGKVRGIAGFTSEAGDPNDGASDILLHEFCFTAGVRTDRRVGFGSSLSALRNAYGSRLERVSGQKADVDFAVIAQTAAPRISIGFELANHRVVKIHVAYFVNLGSYC